MGPVQNHQFENVDVKIEFDESGEREVMLYFNGSGYPLPTNEEKLGVLVDHQENMDDGN